MINVLIGAPVHNRNNFLPIYLESLKMQHFLEKSIEARYVFILNQCDKETWKIFEIFKEDNLDSFKVKLIRADNINAGEDRRFYKYSNIAILRNALLREINLFDDFFFSVDTDIRVCDGALYRLIKNNKDICAALIHNDTQYVAHREAEKRIHPFRKTNALNFRDKKNYKDARHYMDYPINSLFKVDVTGAVYLMRAGVTRCCIYEDHPQGEDVSFCINALKKNFEIWMDSNIFCEHYMGL